MTGDRLELPAGDAHDAQSSGRTGVACLEAHLPAGSLADARPSGGRVVVIEHVPKPATATSRRIR